MAAGGSYVQALGNPLLSLAVVLTAGIVAGLAMRRVRLPAVTGQVLIGVALGTSGLDLLGAEGARRLEPITHFALGLIVATVGSHLHYRRLRNAKRRLLFLVLLELTITPGLVFAAIYALPGRQWVLAALLASMAVATAPGTVVAVVRETRAQGVFVKTLVAAVALNNIACILLFELVHSAVRMGLSPETHTLAQVVTAPLKQLALSAALGAGVGVALLAARRRVVGRDRVAAVSLVALLTTLGVADVVHASPLLSCLFMGMTLSNVGSDDARVSVVFADFEGAIFAIFFTLAGTELNFRYLVPAGLIAGAMVGARAVGKSAASWAAMGLAGAPERVRKYLGMALLPQAGVAVGLMLIAERDPLLRPYRDVLLAAVLSAVAINEIVGPIMTRFALRRSGEEGADRPRLLDFLHEESIVVDLTAATKEEAIAKLCDLLLESHGLTTSREKLLASVLERERELSTYVGDGLAIPHGVLEGGSAIVGVMGISRAGLDYEVPGGERVHCIVLLATPPTQRQRHLEVLGALARAIGADPAAQARLFAAKTPAHAYELLHHAEGDEELDPYLTDAA